MTDTLEPKKPLTIGEIVAKLSEAQEKLPAYRRAHKRCAGEEAVAGGSPEATREALAALRSQEDLIANLAAALEFAKETEENKRVLRIKTLHEIDLSAFKGKLTERNRLADRLQTKIQEAVDLFAKLEGVNDALIAGVAQLAAPTEFARHLAVPLWSDTMFRRKIQEEMFRASADLIERNPTSGHTRAFPGAKLLDNRFLGLPRKLTSLADECRQETAHVLKFFEGLLPRALVVEARAKAAQEREQAAVQQEEGSWNGGDLPALPADDAGVAKDPNYQAPSPSAEIAVFPGAATAADPNSGSGAAPKKVRMS